MTPSKEEMKVLWFYKYDPTYNFDHWFHMDFAKQMIKYGIELKVYGPELHHLYRNLTVGLYNPDKTLDDIYKDFPFQIIICCTKSRMFEYYNPHNDQAYGCWLPHGKKESNIPKVILEEDYHYEKSDRWYHEYKIDLVIQRHYANYIKQFELGQTMTQWLPFSVNPEIFKPNPNIQKTNRIAFTGNHNPTVYPFRNNAKEILKKHNLLHDYGNRAREALYIECLQNYVSHLCGSSIYHVTPAKIFEIMACGSVLFTNESKNYGLEQLFSEGSYVTYKENFSDLLQKANFILNDKKARDSIAQVGRSEILKNHTDEVRVRHLKDILLGVIYGKKCTVFN